jgi:hypothetical protein
MSQGISPASKKSLSRLNRLAEEAHKKIRLLPPAASSDGGWIYERIER